MTSKSHVSQDISARYLGVRPIQIDLCFLKILPIHVIEANILKIDLITGPINFNRDRIRLNRHDLIIKRRNDTLFYSNINIVVEKNFEIVVTNSRLIIFITTIVCPDTGTTALLYDRDGIRVETAS